MENLEKNLKPPEQERPPVPAEEFIDPFEKTTFDTEKEIRTMQEKEGKEISKLRVAIQSGSGKKSLEDQGEGSFETPQPEAGWIGKEIKSGGEPEKNKKIRREAALADLAAALSAGAEKKSLPFEEFDEILGADINDSNKIKQIFNKIVGNADINQIPFSIRKDLFNKVEKILRRGRAEKELEIWGEAQGAFDLLPEKEKNRIKKKFEKESKKYSADIKDIFEYLNLGEGGAYTLTEYEKT